ncbi:MAG TPA: branched-chain amino acid aminotransferase [Syntrophales bacterium]|nr:branched-chain amino acid aminotransferase [Syntrophales bacterium]
MEITIRELPPEKRKAKPADEAKLGFGKFFTDHMFTLKYNTAPGWHDAMIGPYQPLTLDPTAMCLHYGQEIFEGLKAYRGRDGAIYLFRPEENIRRMNASAERLCMPPVDPALFLDALKTLVRVEKDWIPHSRGASLYIRPTMIATEPALGVHPAGEYLFFIVVGPVGAYYAEGFAPTKIFVSEDYVRAVRGGMGNCKAAGNYAASLYASRIASDMGYTQVLWLDAIERKYAEEVGTSNIFFVIGDELVTPPLAGSILPGVTRNSVLQIARHWGGLVAERPVAIAEVIEAAASGDLKEAFASGTAAIVSPIGQIYYRGQEHVINGGRTGPLTERLYNEILQIQYGEKDDPFGWRMQIA